MAYKIRQNIIDKFGCRSVKVQNITGELFSDVPDVTGREICEGDRVRLTDSNEEFVVTCHDAAFWVGVEPLLNFTDGALEIVGYGED